MIQEKNVIPALGMARSILAMTCPLRALFAVLCATCMLIQLVLMCASDDGSCFSADSIIVVFALCPSCFYFAYLTIIAKWHFGLHHALRKDHETIYLLEMPDRLQIARALILARSWHRVLCRIRGVDARSFFRPFAE